MLKKWDKQRTVCSLWALLFGDDSYQSVLVWKDMTNNYGSKGGLVRILGRFGKSLSMVKAWTVEKYQYLLAMRLVKKLDF